MIGVIQRVSTATVRVNDEISGHIRQGILLLLGVEKSDTEATMQKLCKKIIGYRIFSDSEGKMNLSLQDIGGELLVVSQFTLVAETQKGMRPSFSKGATPQQAEILYEKFIEFSQQQGIKTASGKFGQDMQVSLNNDGPVTFILTSH